MPSTEQIARVCHDANASWCRAIGDYSQTSWFDAPSWQRASALEGVEKALAGATPQELHESWCQAKIRDGWVFGVAKDPEARTHPCLVPYDELSEEQRRKDALFAAIVGALR